MWVNASFNTQKYKYMITFLVKFQECIQLYRYNTSSSEYNNTHLNTHLNTHIDKFRSV